MATVLLSDFYELESVGLTIQILFGEPGDLLPPDISGDIVKLTLKETDDTPVKDATPVLEENADVAAEGADGKAIFSLTPAQIAAVEPRQYYYDIVWYPVAGGNYVLNQPDDKIVDVYPRVSSVTP